MHDDELTVDDAWAIEADEDDEMDEREANGHILAVRRANGEVVATLSTLAGPEGPWNVYLQPGGGAIRNAYLGAQDAPVVWVNTDSGQVERDEDGTYVIRID
ncbi:hypothetical protein [Mycobacterium hubeiense]|uniref:hypothetical protein n=1 Tax=Mycobacterium hubeiense TaxID=1867256 RepID=UPI001E581F47|nr:hypothetical protein [Mycobacterium sp. QGD 101]